MGSAMGWPSIMPHDGHFTDYRVVSEEDRRWEGLGVMEVDLTGEHCWAVTLGWSYEDDGDERAHCESMRIEAAPTRPARLQKG